MLTIRVQGAHTHVLSTLCSACPYAAAGCCRAPPRLDWSDIGRVVSKGGRDWLLAEMAAGRLRRIDRGLALERRKTLPRAGGPREVACVYLGERGCTIDAARRPATCNYYVCDEAITDGRAEGERARAIHDALVKAFVAWDEATARRIASTWPEGPPYDAAFFDWLGAAFEALSRGLDLEASRA